MYIQPNTTIKFLQNIPFDADYNDTVYFTPEDGVQGQYNYFNAKAKYTIQNNMYQRVNKNELKVSLPYTGITYESTAEKLYDCNYMMFQNTNFGNKWFYAFIKNVEWVNNETAKITYEIDEMQTWMFDYDLEQCFVEREHSATDEIGDNLVPENLDMGYEMIENFRYSYTIQHVKRPTTEDELKNGWCVVVFCSNYPSSFNYMDSSGTTRSWADTPYSWGGTDTFGSVISGLYCFVFNDVVIPLGGDGSYSLRQSDYFYNGDLYELYGFLEQFLSDTSTNLVPDDIINLYMCPNLCISNSRGINRKESIVLETPTFLGGTSLSNSYIPLNKKLLTYPYVQLNATNFRGDYKSYKYEYFEKSIPPTFKITGVPVFSPTLVCYPTNYKPSEIAYRGNAPTNAELESVDFGLCISSFTQCAWVGDTFKAWWAQNKNSINTSKNFGIITSVISMLTGAALIGGTVGSGGTLSPFLAVSAGSAIASGGLGVGKAIASTNAKMTDAQNMPPSPGGSVSDSALFEIADIVGFAFIGKSITTQQAKIIDDYFTMFGYACHEVKTPSRNARPKWTYTQTVGCTIKARCPGDSQKKICQIYDKGIRFWNKNAEIGKYYNANGSPVDNKPTNS